jgi:phage head maturation protease
VRRLDTIDLWEISVVTFPMLPEARVSAVKRSEGRSPLPRGVHHGRREQARLAQGFRRAARMMRQR